MQMTTVILLEFFVSYLAATAFSLRAAGRLASSTELKNVALTCEKKLNI